MDMMKVYQPSKDRNQISTAILRPIPRGVIQRKCACGGSAARDGECEQCGGKQLQRKAAASQSAGPFGAVVPPIVHDVLRSSGKPLDADTRAFMEPRFRYDFSQVRVLADSAAGSAAQAIHARAYTHGHNIVFGAGEYSPATAEGKKLLAHELTHVVQQSESPWSGTANQIGPANDPAEAEADRVAETVASSEAAIAPGHIVQRKAGIISKQGKAGPVNCPPSQHGAPADPAQHLAMLQTFALLAVTVADMDLTMLQFDAVLPGLGTTAGGFVMPTGPRMQNYTNRFGLPPAAGRGKFRNRLSGTSFPSQAQALVEEAKSLQGRYSRIADFLGGSNIRFSCITHSATVGGCEADCSGTPVAFGCPTVILLCPKFWSMRPDEQSQLLIHEVAHTIFGVLHGHNFSHADCYAAYASDAQGRKSSSTTPPCVP
jgi:Domain of unknown function (DUF4157)